MVYKLIAINKLSATSGQKKEKSGNDKTNIRLNFTVDKLSQYNVSLS